MKIQTLSIFLFLVPISKLNAQVPYAEFTWNDNYILNERIEFEGRMRKLGIKEIKVFQQFYEYKEHEPEYQIVIDSIGGLVKQLWIDTLGRITRIEIGPYLEASSVSFDGYVYSWPEHECSYEFLYGGDQLINVKYFSHKDTSSYGELKYQYVNGKLMATSDKYDNTSYQYDISGNITATYNHDSDDRLRYFTLYEYGNKNELKTRNRYNVSNSTHKPPDTLHSWTWNYLKSDDSVIVEQKINFNQNGNNDTIIHKTINDININTTEKYTSDKYDQSILDYKVIYSDTDIISKVIWMNQRGVSRQIVHRYLYEY